VLADSDDQMSDLLRKLNVEVTTRCNLDCTMCMRRILKESTGDMSMETFLALLPVLPDIESLNVIGIGEPMLNGNIIDMVELGKNHLPHHGFFSLTTNGTLVDHQAARQLVSAGLDSCVISIDAATPQTYAEIRRGATLEDALAGIRHLHLAKREMRSASPMVGIEFVAMKKNTSELPQLVELAAEHGVSFIIASHLLPHTEEMRDEVLYDFNSDQAIELFEEAKAEAGRRNLDLSFESLDIENYSNALFGVPPLKDRLRSQVPEWTQVPGYDKDTGRLFQLLDETVAKARSQNVCMSFKNLMSRNGADLAAAQTAFAQAQANAERLGIYLSLPPVVPKAQRECGFIRDGTAFVSWDGYVRPCNNLYHSYTCYVNGREKSITAVTFGNVAEHSLQDIWNLREYRSFRRQVGRFDFAPCGDCPHAEACFALLTPVFRKDCYEYALPCGDCPWARGILKCM
jgi:putative metalloenzyme radical SAM/SPASM domain maturase